MPTEPPVLSRRLLWLMAIACGVSVASVYYNQPLLGTLATYFHAQPWQAGLVATAAQVGYGAGIFFFLPLGDLIERRGLIVVLVYVCAGYLVAITAAPTLGLLSLARRPGVPLTCRDIAAWYDRSFQAIALIEKSAMAKMRTKLVEIAARANVGLPVSAPADLLGKW